MRRDTRSHTDLRSVSGETLRKWRLTAGLSRAEAAARLEWSESKVKRIETARVGVTGTDAKALADLYGRSDSDAVEQLLAMANRGRKPDWFAQYKRSLSAEYQQLLAFEGWATRIRSVNGFVFPGLLQTPEYARALLALRHDGERLEDLVAARAERQRVLKGADGPHFQFLVNEALLHHRVGGPDGLARQLDHLARVARLPRVDLRVLPLSVPEHPGLWEQFLVLRLPESPVGDLPAETVVYREVGGPEELVRGDAGRIARYEADYETALGLALGREESLELVSRLRADLPADPDGGAAPVS